MKTAKKGIFYALATIVVFSAVIFVGSEAGQLTKIKQAQAETQCPPPQTSSHIKVWQGSTLLGEYHTSSASPFVTASLTVPAGTVLAYHGYTEGVELVNQTQGSVQSTNLPVTVASTYYPNGYSFIKRPDVIATTDPLQSSGDIHVGGTNSCLGGDPLEAQNLGESRLTLSIVVSPPPPPPPPPASYTISLSSDQTIPQGQSAVYTLSVTCAGGFSGPLTNLAVTSGYGTSVTYKLVTDTGAQYTANTSGSPYVFSGATFGCGGSGQLQVINTSNPSSFDSRQALTLTATVPAGVTATPGTTGLTITPLAVSVDISADPSAVNTVQSTTTISWWPQNAQSCTASNDKNNPAWQGAVSATDGLHTLPNVSLTSTTVFTITCVNGPNSSVKSTTVTHTPTTYALSCTPNLITFDPNTDPGPPTFTVTVSSANPTGANRDVTINASSSGLSFSYAPNPINPAGSVSSTVSISGQQPGNNYAITVSGSTADGASVSGCSTNLSVSSLPPPPPPPPPGTPPTVTFQCSPNNGAGTYSPGPCQVTSAGVSGYLSWTSQNATACSMDRALLNYNTAATPPAPAGDISVPINHTGTATTPINAPTSFRLTCTGTGGSTDSTVSFTVPAGGGSYNLNQSAKHAVAVNEPNLSVSTLTSSGYNGNPCDGTARLKDSLINYNFKEGDIVTFAINICNTGTTDLVFNGSGDNSHAIILTDVLGNLAKPSAGWNAQVSCGNDCQISTTDDTQSGKVIFTIQAKPGGAANRLVAAGGLWTLFFNATIKAPVGATQSHYYFTNCVADSGTAAMTVYNAPAAADDFHNITGSTIEVPGFMCVNALFSRGANAPDRHEIAP